MEERRLGPVVGLGTWSTFEGDVPLARQVADAAFSAETRIFDTSPMYREAERTLAAALGARRPEATVATKIWASSVEEGREQLRRQLEWYGGQIEIEQVHNLVGWREHVTWLEEERDAGRVGRLGVTHYSPSAFGDLERALETRHFDVLQVPYNPWERECERTLLPLAHDLGVAVLAMRPLGGSGADARRSIAPTAAELAELGCASWAEALLRWALADPRIDAVLPATSRPERVRENARAGDGRILSADGRALVQRLAGIA